MDWFNFNNNPVYNFIKFIPLKIMLAVGLSHTDFIMLMCVSSSFIFPKTSIMKVCWFYQNFLQLLKWICDFKSHLYELLHLLTFIYWTFSMSRIRSTWSWWMIFFIYNCIMFASILLRILHICSSGILICSFLLFLILCPCLVWALE